MKRIIALFSCLLWLEANAATPSYSNFSSNQFAPSGTYTVTVKAKAEMTNTVFRGVGTPAAELHGGWLSTNDTSGSITVMSNASTVWSNGVAAGSVAITNAGGIMNLEGGPFGTVLQFRFNTSGTPAMIISNGCVGIRLAPPAGFSFGVGGIMKATGDIRTDSSVYPSANLGVSSGFIGVIDKNMMYAPAESYVSFKGKDQTGNGSLPNATNGCAIILLASTNVLGTHETSTNTVIGSQGTNLYIGDGITANSSNVATMQFSFQTSGTPVMVISNGLVGIEKIPVVPYVLDVAGKTQVGAVTISGLTASINWIGFNGGGFFYGKNATNVYLQDASVNNTISFTASNYYASGFMKATNGMMVTSNSWVNVPALNPGDNFYCSSNGRPYVIWSDESGVLTTNKLF